MGLRWLPGRHIGPVRVLLPERIWVEVFSKDDQENTGIPGAILTETPQSPLRAPFKKWKYWLIIGLSNCALASSSIEYSGLSYTLLPELADGEPIDVSGDGTIWQIKIREDAKWENRSLQTFTASTKILLQSQCHGNIQPRNSPHASGSGRAGTTGS
ncbi:MAG TPA: hypothetical protein GX729_01240 [Firmicutes bacterium]|nr:hypothetical protein [Bacillota bacterium]